jgi:type IV pilus assembly protein PilM
LWVSSAPEQVDWLRQAVTLAGMTPALADVEACALTNAFTYTYQPEPDEVSLLLHVGAREATIALARGGTLLYSRGAHIAHQRGSFESPHLAVRIAREIDRHWADLAERASPDIIERVYVSGGPARDPRLTIAIGEQTGLAAAVINPFHRIHYTGATESSEIAASHSPAMTIAVGLALRSFHDL